jgi:trehalose 6-phosphate synthase
VFRHADWRHYIDANQRFADAVLEEIGTGKALILVQDYQLALVPALLKSARPDLKVGLFWHIPWPNAEAFRICPWRVEILKGMLGADLVGFHLQQHCNNFLDSVDRMVEARLDWDSLACRSGSAPSAGSSRTIRSTGGSSVSSSSGPRAEPTFPATVSW